MPQIELSIYLSTIARHALQHIRWLEWVLPYFKSDEYLSHATPGWPDYLDTLQMMEQAMSLRSLTFTINISASEYNYHYGNISSPRIESAWECFEEIVLPVTLLADAGLKDFFLYLRRVGGRDEEREFHERRLETAIMGQGYDSLERGKPKERYSSMVREDEGYDYSYGY